MADETVPESRWLLRMTIDVLEDATNLVAFIEETESPVDDDSVSNGS